MNPVKIVGVGKFLPGAPIPNSKMEEVFTIREDWIDSVIGTKTRHFSVDLDEKQVKYELADLCHAASVIALENAGMKQEDIDIVVMSTATPDHLMPATVNLVADRLGMNNIPTFEIQAGCSGAMQGLQVAHSMLLSGSYRNALVIGGDVCNKYLDFRRDFKKMRSSELINLALFGDGAGAAVVSALPEQKGIKIETIANRFEGLGRDPGQMMNWFGTMVEKGDRDSKGNKIQPAKEDYKAIELHVPQMAKEMVHGLTRSVGWNIADVNHFMPPQLGGHITDKIVEFLEIDPEKAINCVAQTGNNGNALPYLQLEILASKMLPGDKAIGVAIESSKWIKTGIALMKDE